MKDDKKTERGLPGRVNSKCKTYCQAGAWCAQGRRPSCQDRDVGKGEWCRVRSW